MRLQTKNPEGRIGLIDEVRGFAILCMVVYHGVYDVITVLGVNIPAFTSPVMNVIRDLFAFGFIFISGTASRFSHSNLKRGLICFGIGMGMTAVTAFVLPQELIVFGILHCLGICMMLFPLAARLLDRIPAPVGCTVLILLFFSTYQLAAGHLFFGPLSIELPVRMYTTSWLFPLGFPNGSFYSADYFPLLPWMFAFFLGGYFGRYLKNGNPPAFFKKVHLRPLAFVGRHTLVIYILHQPVLYGAVSLIALLLGRG